MKFKDDLIVMIKDNPTPVILPMVCLGAKPIVTIVEGIFFLLIEFFRNLNILDFYLIIKK